MPFDPAASFGKSLFFGELLEDQLFPYPSIDADTRETVQAICDSIDKYMAGLDGRKLDQAGDLPPELIQSLREMGMFGLIVPTEYGGLGLTNTGYARVMEQVASWDGSVAVTVGAHSSIGIKGLLLLGTKEQRERWLPKLATGEMIGCFCLTEPGSGSDAFSIKTRADKQADGSYILNGQKLWITNGGIADFFTVFAKTTPDTPEHKGKITAFVVTKDLGGVTAGPHEDKMGIRASNTTAVYFDNVRVPADHVIGEEGKGFKVAMAILNHGRTGLGSGAVGGQKRMLQLATAHANERKQFGKPIGEFVLIQEKLGRMACNAYASESLCYFVSALIDRGAHDYSLEGAATKVFNSEALWSATDEALQIAAGMGFMKEQPYERAMRDARINRIFEGTNEILRLYVGLTGIQKPGEYLKGLGKELSTSLTDPIKGFGLLRDYAERKVKQNVPLERFRSQLTKAHASMHQQVSWIEDSVQELAALSETILRRYGKEIVGTQLPTKRLADIAIDLLAMCCVISRTTAEIEKRGVDKCQHELNMTFAFCSEAYRRIRTNFRAAAKNNDEELKAVARKVLETGHVEHDLLK